MVPRLLAPLLAFVLPSSQTTQAPEQPTEDPVLTEARARLVAGDFDGAVERIEPFVLEQEPNAQAWLLLGLAFGGRGDVDDAVGVLAIAAEDDAVAGRAHFEAARFLAREGRGEEALEHVERSLGAGFVGGALFWNDAAFADLRESGRLLALVPKPPDSSSLFTEAPRVIHTFHGEAPGDVFGWIGRDLGDADGDGVPDLLVSAPYSGEGGPSSGKVYVHSGKTGALLFTRTGRAGEMLGIGIESAGDVDADGRMDALCGAANLGVGSGTAYVYSGEDGSTLLTLATGEPFDALGRKVSGGVDLDGDGHDDVLVGAPGAGPNGDRPGKAHVFSGHTGELLATVEGERGGDAFGAGNAMWKGGELALLAIGAANAGDGQRGRTYVYRWEDGGLAQAFTIESDETGVALGGMFVSFPGDFDGDGVSEVYASDWQNAAKGASTGRVYVHSGASGERLFTLTGDAAGHGFGTCTADVGDVTGDGVADLLVGAWQVPDAAPGGGKCTLYSGADLEALATYTCNAPGETFGFDTTGVGDLDGDGGIDFLITGGYSNVSGPRSGRAFVIAGPVFDAR